MSFIEIAPILIFALTVHFLLILISIGVGRFIVDRAIDMESETGYLRVGTYFFVGVAFLVVCVRTGTYFSGDARLTVFSVALVLLFAYFFDTRRLCSICVLFLSVVFQRQ